METKPVSKTKKPARRAPAAPTSKPVAAIDLKKLLAIPAQIDAGIQRVLDKLTGFSPAAVAPVSAFEVPATPLHKQNALRYETLEAIICGGKGQAFVEEIAVEGVQPTRDALKRYLDRVIAANIGRVA